MDPDGPRERDLPDPETATFAAGGIVPTPGPRVERDEDGRPVWIHVCCGEEVRVCCGEEVRAVLPLGERGWAWTEDGGLSPSIRCHGCGVHGYWVGGDIPAWRAC